MLRKPYIILALLVLVYLINGICSINSLSVTADEGSHLSYGIRILKGDPERYGPEKDNSKMPISVINTIPRAVEQLFSKDLKRDDYGVHDTINGRYITLLFSVLIILLVFVWGRDLYGVNSGLFAAFLFICCPNNMANAVLVTTDTYAVFFLLATMYFLWKYCNSRSTKHFIWFAVMLALSQLAKQSLFHLYVLAPLCFIIYALVMKERVRLLPLLKNLLIIVSISWLLINVGFIFYKMNMRLGEYHFMSTLFQRVQNIFPGNLPLPLSKAFVTGLDQAKYYDQLGGGQAGSSFANVTILGHSSTGRSFWYYYFVSIFFKTPITYFILAGWAKWLLFTKWNLRSFIKNEFFLLAPMVYYLLLLSFFYKTQCGIRHIIFIYPLLFIFSGIIIKYFQAKRDLWLLVLLSLFLVISVGRYFNNYYPYTNEFIGDKKNAYQYVGASNLNIDQGSYFIDKYLQDHPDVKKAPATPQSGKFVLPVDWYLDIWNTGNYPWLRKLKPSGELFYSYLLFDVQPKDIEP